MHEVKKEMHHGVEVQTNTITDEMRKTECLCLNCGHTVCVARSKLYNLCCKYDIALMVTRCEDYKVKTEATQCQKQ